jgi:LmbE family N-acetylglucosaminyl deacetylase/tetratricopeptide (TPR) repeat protein
MLALLLSAFLLQATYIDLYNEGHRLLDEGRFTEAEVVLKESASLNPKYVPALKSLAQAYVKQRRVEEAIKLYEQIAISYPADITARDHLAELYSWTGDYDKSIVTYRDALELDPLNKSLKNGLATVLRWSHRYDEAERLYNEVLASDPGEHGALKGLARVYSTKGNLSASLDVLDRAISRYPDDAELHKEKGTVLAWQKNYREAVLSLKEAVRISPKYATAYRTLGDVYQWMKDYPRSIEAYRTAVEIEPDNIENYLHLGEIYRITDQRSFAEDTAKAALKIDPTDTHALNLLRSVREQGGAPVIEDIGEALELVAFFLVFTAIFFVSRSRKRMLRRKHRFYFYFVNFVLPTLVILTFVSFMAKGSLSVYLNKEVIENFTEVILFLALGVSFLALLWTEHRNKEFAKMVVLAVGAHPDDIELGCAGFILKAKDSGARVYGLTMTKGEKGAEGRCDREAELKRAARFMEFDGLDVLDFPDMELKGSVSSMKDAIEARIKEVGANVVLTHTSMDVHTDHRAVFEATQVAARKISIMCYENVSTPGEFVPNYFVDVTGYIEDKLRLVSFHRSQGDKSYMDPEVIKGRAAHRGLQANVQYAEAYKIHKLLT